MKCLPFSCGEVARRKGDHDGTYNGTLDFFARKRTQEEPPARGLSTVDTIDNYHFVYKVRMTCKIADLSNFGGGDPGPLTEKMRD